MGFSTSTLSANDVDGTPVRLGDFPAVFLSFDEPWADRNWRDLKGKLPAAVRVHGVKGFDACHKSAAAAVPGDWVLTVDADTRISPRLAEAPVPRHLLTGNFRLDWLSRNPVNGLWSGNGSVKLWPKALINEMRTHEAAPEGTLSLDHDIGGIRFGRSAQVMMPERAALTDPAETAFHAFRAGLREAVFLRSLGEKAARLRNLTNWWADPPASRLIEVWCSIGRHTLNGRWMLYGSRLGLLLPDIWSDWDPHQTNDLDAIRRLWSERVVPRFQRGSGPDRCEDNWNWQLLESDLRSLAQAIKAEGAPAIVEFDAVASRHLAQCDLLSSPVSPARLDSLGYKLMQAAKSPQQHAAAQAVLEQAAALDHPAAHDNLGRLHLRGSIAGADPARAAWHFGVAAALGNPEAASRLAELANSPVGPSALAQAGQANLAIDLPAVTAAKGDKHALTAALRQIESPICLVLDPDVTLGQKAAAHVPDPVLAEEGLILGCFSVCAMTGLPRPRGIRIATPQRLIGAPDAPADAVLPVVLGVLAAPASAIDALNGGLADGGGGIPLLMATLGRDGPFGDYWVLGSLLARIGKAPGRPRLRQLAALKGAALDAEIDVTARILSVQKSAAVPVWSRSESQALKRMISTVPARRIWQDAATALASHGPAAKAQAAILQETATAIWGGEAETV